MGDTWRPKVGEFVVCLDNEGHKYIKNGSVGIITAIHSNWKYFRVNGYNDWWFNTSTFIPLDEILKEE